MIPMPQKLSRRQALASSLLAPGAAMLSALSGCQPAPQEVAPSEKKWAFVGTYTRSGSKGIYRVSYDVETGRMDAPELAAATPGPSFLALHPNKRFLYAVNELSEFQGEPGGSVTAFAVDAQMGRLQEINAMASRGGGPCHLLVAPKGNALVAANYGGGSTVSYRLLEDDSLSSPVSLIQHKGSGPNQNRQKEPHAHGVCFSSVGQQTLVHVADLGTDQIYHYQLADDATLTPWETQPSVAVKPGAGPRHVIKHPSRPLAYSINELDSTITVFSIDATTGAWTPVEHTSTLPEDFDGTSYTAEIELHPNGNVIYASNRGSDTLAVLALDSSSPKLRHIGFVTTEGEIPRSFAVEPTGRWVFVANQKSGSVGSFRVHAATGLLQFTGESVSIETPVCVVFV